jgi:hypothetical protein
MTMSRKNKAQMLHKKLTACRQTLRNAWYDVALTAIEFEEGEFFKEMGHDSMKAYLTSYEDDVAYSTIAEGIAAVKVGDRAGIERDQLGDYSKENLKILAKLPESKIRNKNILAAAKEMTAKDFRKFVNERADVALEEKTRYIIDCVPTQVTIYDAVVARMQQIAEANGETFTRADAFEYLGVSFLQKYQDQKPENVKLKLKRKITLEPQTEAAHA